MSDDLKVILTNQRQMMLALAQLCRESSGAGHAFNADRLMERVKMLERNYDFIARPSERLA